MQSVSAAWTAEERDVVRKIAQSTQISWHKESTLGGRTFTIGVSLIGGNDIIGVNPGSIGSPGNFRYFDESAYVMSLSWEHSLSMPTGGLTRAMAGGVLDNTSGRFTPRHMGGNSELYTAIVPNRPIIIGAGFNIDGVDQTIPQFSGQLNGQPEVNMRDRTLRFKANDYVDYFSDKKLDQNVMFTAQRTDQVLASLLSGLGMNTAQYDLDYGINVIPFGLFPSGSNFREIIHKLTEAENGHFYQDENGVFKFENRQHWDSTPYTQVQRIISTGQVLDAQAPDDSHLINIVEVKGEPRAKEENQLVWQATGFAGIDTTLVTTTENKELWINFDDPMLAIDTPVPNGTTDQTSFFVANSDADGTGTDLTSDIYVKSIAKFATTAKITFANRGTQNAYIVSLDIWGRPARRTGDVYYRSERGASITAFQEHSLLIENEFIQSLSWAETYGEMILRDFSTPENIQKITIRAIPELQNGDLVSWQGRYWRIYEKRTILDPGVGFTQELTLLQRTIVDYFRIGISTIGGTDRISP